MLLCSYIINYNFIHSVTNGLHKNKKCFEKIVQKKKFLNTILLNLYNF